MGVVLLVVAVVALSGRVPTMDDALTLNSPSSPFLTASRSIKRTLLSRTVELNFRARSTIKLPHLRRSTHEELQINFLAKG